MPQFKSQAWKNGGGSTTELLKFPDNDDYDLRLSIATVERSGPFSQFQGYQRTIIQLEGEPMKLHHPDLNQSKALELLSPYSFDGGWVTDCDVTTTARDFNVIHKKSITAIATGVELLPPGAKKIIPVTNSPVFLFCVNGAIRLVSEVESDQVALSANELCFVDRNEKIEQIAISTGHEGATLILISRFREIKSVGRFLFRESD